jgi:hypothetical protein
MSKTANVKKSAALDKVLSSIKWGMIAVYLMLALISILLLMDDAVMGRQGSGWMAIFTLPFLFLAVLSIFENKRLFGD